MEIRSATPVMIGQRIADGCDQEWTSWRTTRDAVEHAEDRTSTRRLDGDGRTALPAILLPASGIQGSGVRCVKLSRPPHVQE
jgi:hypothetical protein